MKNLILFALLIINYSIIHCQNVGIGTATPKATLNVAEGKTVLFGADSNGAGIKMMWIPSKAAFRAGEVHTDNAYYWDYANIGRGSFAAGIRTNALGDYSMAAGYLCGAQGAYSTAFGNTSFALNINSIAIGYYSTATGIWSTAIGGGEATASGDNSISIGENINAKAGFETVLGRWNTDYTPATANDWNSADRLFTIGNGTANDARSDALVILKNGNIGIGTSTPVAKLEVNGGVRIQGAQTTHAQGIALEWNKDGNSGASYLLNQKGLGGGGFVFGEIDNANNITHRIDINQDGNVGIGTANPAAKLNVAGDEFVDGIMRLRNPVTPGYYGKIEHTGTNGNFHLDTYGTGGMFLNYFSGTDVNIGNGASGVVATFYTNGNLEITGTLSQGSDVRLKKNIEPLQSQLGNVLQLNGYTYNWKDPSKNPDQQIGLLAQEVQKIYPQLVSQSANGNLSVNYISLVPVMIEGMKEQQKQIEILRKDNARLAIEQEEIKKQVIKLMH